MNATIPTDATLNHLEISVECPKELFIIARALASEVRISILRLLSERNMNVNEIAVTLGIPTSTAALNVRVLEEAKLIHTRMLPGVRGAMKLCSRRVEGLTVNLIPEGR